MSEPDHNHVVTTAKDGDRWRGMVDGVPVTKKGGEVWLFKHETDAFEAADLSAWCMDQERQAWRERHSPSPVPPSKPEE